MNIKQLSGLILASAAAFLAGCAPSPQGRSTEGLARIEHIVVIYAENRSFDHLYGLFPGADGIASATPEQKTQLDHDGKPLPHLPPVYEGGKPSPKSPRGPPNSRFRLDAPPVNRRTDEVLPSPIHAYYHNREQINGGRNNMFVAMSTAGAWVMGYFGGSKMKLWKWAQEYTLADHFFMAAFGGSYLNHQWLVCACTPIDAGAPENAKAVLEGNKLKKKPGSPASVLQGPVEVMDGRISPDGYTVNTPQPASQPTGIPPAEERDFADPAKHPVPPLNDKTIGDTLSAKGISWTWYAGGYNQALQDRKNIYSREAGSPNFQPHHQPFNYYARFAPGSAERAQPHSADDDRVADIDRGALPQVVFYKPTGRLNQHPSYTDLASGDEHIDDLLMKLRNSPQWKRMAIVVTYDEN